MVSDDEQSSSTTQPQEHHIKRRRLHGACDICRRKKIKCNSAEMPNKICSNCIAYNLECTHNIPRHASKKETEKGYIQALEERLDKMEHLLRHVRPELDIEQSFSSPNSPESVPSVPTPPSITTYPQSRSTPGPVTDLPYPTPQTLPDSAAFHASPRSATNDLSEEEDLAHISLSERLSQLAVDTIEDRFFGKSSAFMLMQHASHVKQEVTGLDFSPGRNLRRPFFWDLRAWEVEHVNSDLPQFEFPEKDLRDKLVSLYFERVNIYIPLLHRPTFERDLANDLHLHDVGFAQLVLMVSALASRCTDDPRVLLPNEKTTLSSGFKYFRQTRLMRNKLLDKTTLYDLQYYCLVIPFLLASSLPQTGWSLIGLALRFAQERGAHRRRGEGSKPTVVSELWKRCFWVLIAFDRLTSSFIGRPCAIQDEDFDADLPIECDDEYWECEDPEQNWKQPSGKPSKITAFNAHLRLCEILAFTLRTLYSTKKSKLLTGLIGDQWEQRVVAELDSSMNKWKDSLPDHLRWNPNQENITFLHQSACIHTTYYYLQIQIHRPFIQKTSPLSFPSLAMCTNAARTCCHLVDAKGPGWIYPFPNISTFASGIVLLLHMYGGRRAGLKTDQEKEMKDIQRCMDTLRVMETKWHVAGRLFDVLLDLATIQEGQVPVVTKFVSSKRPRDGAEQVLVQESASSIPPRPQKSRPVRQPKGWPPTPPTGPTHKPTPSDEGDRNQRHGVTPPGLSSLATSHNASFQTPPTASDNAYPPPHTGSTPSGGPGWDLSHLLLAQMNFGTTPQPFDNQAAQMQDYSNVLTNTSPPFASHTGPSGAFPGRGQLPASSIYPSTSYDQAMVLNQDMAALWSDAPSNFNIEEWDQFVANINTSGSLWSEAHVDFNSQTY